MEFKARTEEDMHFLGRALSKGLKDGDVVTLDGALGAGKTQLAQGVGEGLGIVQKLVSPTFNLVFEYEAAPFKLYHFDLYRLDAESQLVDIDFYDLSDSSTEGVSLIEWAELFPEEMPDERLSVRIEVLDSGERIVKATAHGVRAEELLLHWEEETSKSNGSK